MTTCRRTAQRPIGGGSRRDGSAADVLAGLDLTGVLAVVTGGCSGVGLATTRALSTAGADVLVPARRPDRARHRLAGRHTRSKIVLVAAADPAAAGLGDPAATHPSWEVP